MFAPRITKSRRDMRSSRRTALSSSGNEVSVEIARQAGLSFTQDSDDGATVRQRNTSVPASLLCTRQDLPHSLVDCASGLFGKAIESLAVNRVAARIAQQALMQIELPQGAAVAVPRSSRGELFGKARAALNGTGERRFIDEKQVVHQFPCEFTK